MNDEREQSHASSQAVTPSTTDDADDTVEPGQSSRSSLLRKLDHPVASGLVQRETRDENGVAGGAEHAVAAASSSSGSPLPDTLMRKFGGSLGADLAGVRVHTGDASARAAGAVGAKAYTMGNDIHFGAGHYDPATSSGQHLLAHEVAHTVQQSGRVRRMQHKLEVSSPGDGLEQEADRAADAMVAGSTAAVSGTAGLARPASIFRKPGKRTISPKKIGGDTKSKKIIRIAWTIDDGPTPLTGDMKKKLGGVPATWFVMRNEIEKAPKARLAALKAAQDGGSEIAIHSVHKEESHLAWFPSKSKASYGSIEKALVDLAAFQAQLRRAKINAKFVRLPYGEHTEVIHLLGKLGMKGESACADVARKIINGSDISKYGKIALSAKREWKKFTDKIAELGLHNWGGAAAGSPEISAQSWGAESSGVKARQDTVTDHHSPGNPQEGKRGEFERRVDKLKPGKPDSLVVLAHDTTVKDVKEVDHDIKRMEAYAKSKHVRIEYFTMSELYELTRGKQP